MTRRIYLPIFAIAFAALLFSGCAKNAGHLTIKDMTEGDISRAGEEEYPGWGEGIAPTHDEIEAENRARLIEEKKRRAALCKNCGELINAPVGVAHDAVIDIFFDYDRFTIKPSERAALKKDAKFYNDNPNSTILIEGHCDERGTSEYNIALGQRRADSIKKFLTTSGVAASRIKVVSYGKEKPFCKESNESCWKLNRRGHFVVTFD